MIELLQILQRQARGEARGEARGKVRGKARGLAFSSLTSIVCAFLRH